MTPAPLEEIAATVHRMEARLAVELKERRLWAVYLELVPRFESDLAGSPRDIALAKASALMVLQAALELPDS